MRCLRGKRSRLRVSGFRPTIMKQNLPSILLAVVLGAPAPHAARAAEVIKPQLGEPLRDAAVVRAPDGAYYLTGTRAGGQWQGKPDFMGNDGIKVWSSPDLVAWKEAGFALDLKTRSGWRDDPLLQFYFLPERPLGAKYTRALTAPRMAFLGDEAFLSFSMLGRDMRWLRAAGGAGPWKDGRLHGGKPPGHHGGPRELRHGNGPGDGSLFQDKDGAAYLLWGPGYVAKLNAGRDDIDHATQAFLLARIEGYPNAEWCAGQFTPSHFSLTLREGKYLLAWSAFTDGAGHKRRDSFYATAGSVMGPYSAPQPLLPGSGPVVLFETGDGALMASCSIGDAPVLVPLAVAGGKLAAAALPELPAATKAPKPGKLEMFDYANAKPSGKRAERVGEELKYQILPVYSDKQTAQEARVGRNKLTPLFDMPIADVSICKGGDGAWYLTGTVASIPNPPPNPNPNPNPSKGTDYDYEQDYDHDFENNDGIHLWRSTDLDTWTPLGKVWDIEKDGPAWARQFRIPGDNPVRDDLCRGVTAPEIHFLDGTFYLAYSMNGRGTGLLKSKSGKAEGPYEDLGRVTAMGGSPSLFADAGKVYWAFGQGLQLAEIDLGKAALTAAPRDLFLAFLAYPPDGWDAVNRSHFWDITGPFLFRAIDPTKGQPVVAVAFSAVTQTFQRANRDTMAAVGPSLDGPFQAAARMIPNGGQTTVFPGPEGAMLAAFWGADPSAVWRDRAGIVPLEWFAMAQMQWPRMVLGDYHTTRGPWGELVPPVGVPGTRDINVFKDKDGYFYYSASGLSGIWDGGARFWRAKDLRGPWEDIGFLYTMEEMRDDPNWPPLTEKNWNGAKFAWEPQITFAKGAYWMSLWFGGHGWGENVCWKQSTGALLKSTSGKVTGPYALHSRWQHDFQGIDVGEDGTVYGRAGAGEFWRMTGDLKGVDPEWTGPDGKKLTGWPGPGRVTIQKMADGRFFSEDCGTTLYRIGGKWVAGGLTHHSGYDGIFSWADDLRGPWHYMGVVPNLGNAPVAQNVDGKWLTIPQCGNAALFGTPYRNTDKTKEGDLFLYEVVFDMDKPEPSVWPAHDLGHLEEAVYRK